MIFNLATFSDRVDQDQIAAIGKQTTGDLKLNPVQPLQGVDLAD